MPTSTGLRRIHSRSCPRHHSATAPRCSCTPTWQAIVYDARTGKRHRRNFKTESAARAWRADTTTSVRRGTMPTGPAQTIRDAATELTAGMTTGAIRNRSGEAYKPAIIRDYSAAIKHLVKRWGAKRLDQLTRADLRRYVEELQAADLGPSTIRNRLMPLRVIYRRAAEDGSIAVSPLSGLRLPPSRGRREAAVEPGTAAALVAALPIGPRIVYALALYAGLRRGEILGLGWADVDTDARIIHVRQAWCSHTAQMTTPKSSAGTRIIPMPAELRRHLLEHRLAAAQTDGLVCAPGQHRPPTIRTFTDPAQEAWEAAKLAPIGLHECRHAYASLMIAAGIDFKHLSEYMGHAGITVTIDRYGHLLPGAHEQAAAALDRLLAT